MILPPVMLAYGRVEARPMELPVIIENQLKTLTPDHPSADEMEAVTFLRELMKMTGLL